MRVPKTRGFYYAVSDEAIRDYRRLSAWDKLRWLRQAYLFVAKFAPAKAQRLHQRFRAGKI